MSVLEPGIVTSAEPTFFGSLADDGLCHIVPHDAPPSAPAYCGYTTNDIHPGEYDGAAICPQCGLPTCPKCAMLCDLEDRLEA